MRMTGRILVGLLAISATAFAGTAQAAVTIGSNLTGPADESNPGCAVACTTMNLAIPSDTAPGGLTSPVNGNVISWQFKTVTAGGSIALRILRPAGGTSFTGAGTSPAITPISSGLAQGPFATSLPIKKGDSIGLNASAGQTPLIDAPATQLYWNAPTLADGQTLAGTAGVREVAVQAAVEPTNSVTFGSVKRKKKRGTAKVTINVPNAGTLAYGGSRAKVFGPTSLVVGAAIQLSVQAKGKSKKKLNKKGKVKVALAVTFTPTVGTAATSTSKIKLLKKLRHQRQGR